MSTVAGKQVGIYYYVYIPAQHGNETFLLTNV